MGNISDSPRDVIPRTLDQIITQHRDLCALRLSFDGELAELQRTIIADEQDATYWVANWRILCLDRAPEDGGKCHFLLGYAAFTTTPCLSCALVGIDTTWRWAVSAAGSLYRLIGKRECSEPPATQLLQFCAALCSWRVGKFLGVYDGTNASAMRHAAQENGQHKRWGRR